MWWFVGKEFWLFQKSVMANCLVVFKTVKLVRIFAVVQLRSFFIGVARVDKK
jgi:hypothetical protein